MFASLMTLSTILPDQQPAPSEFLQKPSKYLDLVVANNTARLRIIDKRARCHSLPARVEPRNAASDQSLNQSSSGVWQKA
jgi:hypothetical protein